MEENSTNNEVRNQTQIIPAGLCERVGAVFVDVIVLWSVYFFWIRYYFYNHIATLSVWQSLGKGTVKTPEALAALEPAFFLLLASLWLIHAAYYILFPLTSWQGTVGKKLFGIKIVNKDGGKPSFSQIILRWVMVFVQQGIPLDVVFILINRNTHRQTFCDTVAKTYVVKDVHEDYDLSSK